MHNKILFLCPLNGNGGIASWSNKLLASFSNDEFLLLPVDIAPKKDFTKYSGFDRIRYGINAFKRIRGDIKDFARKNPDVHLLHIASGGGLGIIRDYHISKILSRQHYKTILHCHFGNVTEMIEKGGLLGMFFKRMLNSIDQIWVLDNKSANTLLLNSKWKDKVFITPNSIDVPNSCSLQPKEYKRVGFVGNIVPTKGVFELTEAVSQLSDTELFLVGQGADNDIQTIKKISGDKYNQTIHFLGRLPNEEAIKFLDTIDIICLPTYYPGEAFPISILEAMSRGKMVISCPRAAIPDILTSLDGSLCGKLVAEKSASEIAEAIIWCQEHKEEADSMCKKAYEKVKACYRKEVVFDIYRNNYRRLTCE